MFRRRIFYDLHSGSILHHYMARGSLLAGYDCAQEAAEHGFAHWGAFAWEEPDADIEEALSPYDGAGQPRAVLIRIDPAASPPTLTIEHGEPEAPF